MAMTFVGKTMSSLNLLLLTAMLTLAGCGGGGGGGSSGGGQVSSVSSTVPAPGSSSVSSSSVESSSAISSSESSNLAPHVSAGAAQTVVPQSVVTFNAEAFDEDGEIVSWLWEQVDGSGVVVELTNADQLAANFTAPSAAAGLELEFQLTVTDDQGAASSDTVAVTVLTDPNAPLLNIIFPPPRGAYKDTSTIISAFGTVTPHAGAIVSTVEISAGADTVTATVDSEGNWRADDVILPAGVAHYEIVVTAQDDLGRTATSRSELVKYSAAAPVSVGSGMALRDAQAILVDPSGDTAWVAMFSTAFVSGMKIIPVNLRTGHRGASMTEETFNARDMVFNSDKTHFILAAAPTSLLSVGQIVSVSRATGEATLISGPEKGTGPDILAATGLSIATNGDLYLAENRAGVGGTQRVLKIDPVSGDRTVVADETTQNTPANGLSHIAWSSLTEELFMLKNSSVNSQLLAIEPDPFVVRVVGSDTSIGSAGRMTFNSDATQLFVIDANDRIVDIDTVASTRGTLATGITEAGSNVRRDIAYDAKHNLLYVVGGLRQGVFVVDIKFGDVVVISRN